MFDDDAYESEFDNRPHRPGTDDDLDMECPVCTAPAGSDCDPTAHVPYAERAYGEH